MKLAELQKEAQDIHNKHKQFVVILPSGPRFGEWLDPYMGLIQFDGLSGFITAEQLDPFNTEARWID